MKQIQLTQGKVALVNDEDYEKLNQFKWQARKDKNTFYAIRTLPTINGKKGATIYMHHEIIGRPPKGFEADHESGRGLDNQRNNLRFVTRRQNSQNKKNIKKSSQYPGVHWNRKDQKWMTRILINNRRKYLGCFTNEIDAFNAYKQAVESLGETIVGDC